MNPGWNAYEDWIDDVIKKFHLEIIQPEETKIATPMPLDTNRPLTIFVADKAFGTDDVVAVCLLQLLFDQSNIVRTSKKPSEREAVQTVWLNITRTCVPDKGFFDGHNAAAALMTFDADSLDEFGLGLGICGQIWKFFGPLILQKFGALDEDRYVLKAVYREFLQPLDAMSKSPVTHSGSIIYAFNMFNSIGNDDGDHFQEAVMAARAVVHRIIKAHVLRGNVYLRETAVMEAAFTDREDEELLVLPSRCDAVHLFLKDYDPQQEVKFIIQPRNPDQGTWQIWAVDYKRRRFQIDIPIVTYVSDPRINIRSVHPGRYLAITKDRASAIALARASVQAYSKDVVARLKRWWWDQ